MLLIDDEDRFADVLKAHLTLDGFEVVICLDGEDSFDMVRDHLPDIVILDLMLPSVNGIAIAEHIHKFYEGTIVISVSGFYTDQTKDALERFGVKHLLNKPVMFDQLTNIINDSLVQYRPVSRTSLYDVESEVLLAMIRDINAGLTFQDSINAVFEHSRKIIKYERIGIALFNQVTGDIVQRYVNSERPVFLQNGYASELKNTTLEVAYIGKEPRILNDLEEYLKMKPESEPTRKLVTEGMRSNITLPLVVDNECLGFVFFTSERKNNFNTDHKDFLQHASSHISMALSKSLMLENAIISMIQGLAEMGERRDMETGKHMKRLAEYCKVLGEKMLARNYPGLTQELLEDIYFTIPLHDVGKVMIPDAILQKPARLDENEYEKIKFHVAYGADILNTMKKTLNKPEFIFIDTAIDIAKYHHEWYDGSGYLEGLKGEEIPLSARIAALADVFDALMSKRCYKNEMPFDEVVNEIVCQKGTHFSEDIVDIFVEVKDDLFTVWQRLRD